MNYFRSVYSEFLTRKRHEESEGLIVLFSFEIEETNPTVLHCEQLCTVEDDYSQKMKSPRSFKK